MFDFYTGEAQKEDGYNMACFNQKAPDIDLWVDEKNDILGRIIHFDPYRMKPSDEALGMGLDEFYQMYRQPNQKGCIRTPEDIWPH